MDSLPLEGLSHFQLQVSDLDASVAWYQRALGLAELRGEPLVAQGLTNDEIATELVVSPATARTHVSRAMVKLYARDRAQLVVFAYQSGLVRPPA